MKVEKVIYDFEEVQSKMQELLSQNHNILIEQKNNWTTECDIPIKHYSIGSGKNHIVLFGAYHGLEIISAEFLIYSMSVILSNLEEYKDILENYTLDFVPIVNPEGYIITTSAIRKVIPKEYDLLQIQQICNEFVNCCKLDDLANTKFGLKRYQKLFENVTYNDIPDKYYKIKQKLKSLFENFNLPNGVMITWAANANGIDLNANTKYNNHFLEIENNEELYLSYRYSNINYANPGPINCPWNKEKQFELEKENRIISSFLEELYIQNKLSAIFNFHSAGGIIDQRPSNIAPDLKNRNIDIKIKSIENYILAKIYQSETYKDKKNPNNTRYDILKQGSEIGTQNGLYRTIYPMDLLIELSSTIANLLGVYSDIESDYKNTLESNFEALIKSIRNIYKTKEISSKIYKMVDDKNLTETDFINSAYNLIDKIIDNFK